MEFDGASANKNSKGELLSYKNEYYNRSFKYWPGLSFINAFGKKALYGFSSQYNKLIQLDVTNYSIVESTGELYFTYVDKIPLATNVYTES